MNNQVPPTNPPAPVAQQAAAPTTGNTPAPPAAPKITLGGVELTTPKTQLRRISLLLWGKSGCGKTTLASTMPGKKLWISFDPDGCASLPESDDIIIADFSKMQAIDVMSFCVENPMGLAGVIKSQNIESIIIDSATTFAEKALEYGVTLLNNCSIESPGVAGYGRRNSYTMQMVNNINLVAMQNDCHICICSHEQEKMRTDSKGNELPPEHSVMLGGGLKALIPLRLSEVWCLNDATTAKEIWIRSSALRSPMKTRMFKTSNSPKFYWRYNPETLEGDGINTWYELWKVAGGKKIDLPK